MSFLDKAKQMLDQHDDKVDQGLDRAGDAAKQRFAGHDQHIDQAVGQGKQRTGTGDTTASAPPAPEQGDYPEADGTQQGFPPQQR